jgi:hypothetical protein
MSRRTLYRREGRKSGRDSVVGQEPPRGDGDEMIIRVLSAKQVE